MSMACFLGVSSRFVRADLRTVAVVAALTLVAFGVSDIIEIYTGAWYNPPALLVLKAVCIVALLGCYLRYRKLQAASRNGERLARR